MEDWMRTGSWNQVQPRTRKEAASTISGTRWELPVPRSALACSAQLSVCTRDKNLVQARTKWPAFNHMYTSAPIPVAANATSFQVLSLIDIAIRRFNKIATTGGISHHGENTNAPIDSDAASSSTNAIRVKMLVAMPRFSAHRSRRFGWNG